MSNILWIPCYNEGTAETQYGVDGKVVRETRHTSLETLRLLKPIIDRGTFSQVIITNDGSTDDTVEWVNYFKRESWYSDSIFSLIHGEQNRGKMHRFFEVLESLDVSTETLTMTDADMVHFWWPTFSKLTRRGIQGDKARKTMLVSHQWEFVGEWKKEWYQIGSSASGTRNLIMKNVREKMKKMWINWDNIPGRWYGLEMLLHHLFDCEDCAYVQDRDAPLSEIPLFLQPFRKWRAMQDFDTSETSAAIDALIVQSPLQIEPRLWELYTFVFQIINSVIYCNIVTAGNIPQEIWWFPFNPKSFGGIEMGILVKSILRASDPYNMIRRGTMSKDVLSRMSEMDFDSLLQWAHSEVPWEENITLNDKLCRYIWSVINTNK